MFLSIVIPVYNVEATLARCLDSIIAQDVDDMEMILVDDGSTDGSPAIADEYARRYACVSLIRQENGGLSAARNTGIDKATGDYITFVDSDDYLHPDTLQRLVHLIKAHPDVDMFEYSVLTDGDSSERTHRLKDAIYASGAEYWLNAEAYKHTYACNKIFKRKRAFEEMGLRFPVGRVFEDMYFLPAFLAGNPVVMTTSLGYYHYSWNPQGITAQAGGQQLMQLLEAQLRAAEIMGMEFLRDDCKRVPDAECAFYYMILNNQISVCCITGNKPLLPSRKMPLGKIPGFVAGVKMFALNVLGVNAFCKFMRLVKSLL